MNIFNKKSSDELQKELDNLKTTREEKTKCEDIQKKIDEEKEKLTPNQKTSSLISSLISLGKKLMDDPDKKKK